MGGRSLTQTYFAEGYAQGFKWAAFEMEKRFNRKWGHVDDLKVVQDFLWGIGEPAETLEDDVYTPPSYDYAVFVLHLLDNPGSPGPLVDVLTSLIKWWFKAGPAYKMPASVPGVLPYSGSQSDYDPQERVKELIAVDSCVRKIYAQFIMGHDVLKEDSAVEAVRARMNGEEAA